MTTPYELTANIATVSHGGAMLIDRLRRLTPPSHELDHTIATIKTIVADAVKAMRDAA